MSERTSKVVTVFCMVAMLGCSTLQLVKPDWRGAIFLVMVVLSLIVIGVAIGQSGKKPGSAVQPRARTEERRSFSHRLHKWPQMK